MISDLVNQVTQGDCREVMSRIPDNSIDGILTDPPYGLEFMGETWDQAVPGPDFWSEMLRVVKPGGHLLSFGGTRTHHRLMVAIEDAGWILRDTLIWLYSSGFPKGRDISRVMREHGHQSKAAKFIGYGTQLKPCWEPIILAQKIHEGTVPENCLSWGTGALNIGACRVGEEKRFSRPAVPGKRTFNCSYDRPDYKGKWVSGRWPGNAILSEEVSGILHGDLRVFYCPKAGKEERAEYNDHPTVKPIQLLRYLVKLISPPGDPVIMDPFLGSGSTALSCQMEGIRFLGIELDDHFCSIAKRRLSDHFSPGDLSGDDSKPQRSLF